MLEAKRKGSAVIDHRADFTRMGASAAPGERRLIERESDRPANRAAPGTSGMETDGFKGGPFCCRPVRRFQRAYFAPYGPGSFLWFGVRATLIHVRGRNYTLLDATVARFGVAIAMLVGLTAAVVKVLSG